MCVSKPKTQDHGEEGASVQYLAAGYLAINWESSRLGAKWGQTSL